MEGHRYSWSVSVPLGKWVLVATDGPPCGNRPDVYFGPTNHMDDGIYEAVAGSDFVITRVAFRDNSSNVYINDCGSNFTEVTKKLKGKGVDLDNNRFLILQGKVEQIALMKPKICIFSIIIIVID
ncbi:structural maintenance of chromosomes protein 4-like [Magnolia sinica]|uniref:structural maintenance of chromosomes protein 4-like n=1 Tax=Magnolia sinica TaxID=86752 RepID=UPI0026597F0D|nr:structural maintenance of chromosomes protein 4-like [Magnolia sinica]